MPGDRGDSLDDCKIKLKPTERPNARLNVERRSRAPLGILSSNVSEQKSFRSRKPLRGILLKSKFLLSRWDVKTCLRNIEGMQGTTSFLGRNTIRGDETALERLPPLFIFLEKHRYLSIRYSGRNKETEFRPLLYFDRYNRYFLRCFTSWRKTRRDQQFRVGWFIILHETTRNRYGCQ